jgi:hypothetical protein
MAAARRLIHAEAVLVVGLVVEQRHQQAARVVHHARAHRVRQAPGRTHGKHGVARLQVQHVGELGVGEGLGPGRQRLQHGQVGQRVGADQPRRQLAAVGEDDAETLAVLGDVGVGGDVALRRDHRAAAAGHAEYGLALLVVLADGEDAHHHRQHAVTGRADAVGIAGADAGRRLLRRHRR